MRYCLSGRQSNEYLALADEIKVEFRDKESILDILEINPEATIILTMGDLEQEYIFDFATLTKYNGMCRGGFIVAIKLWGSAQKCKDAGLHFMFDFPAWDPYTLNQMASIGACSAYIAGFLCHRLDYFQNFGDMTTRIVVNSSNMIEENNKWTGYMMGGWFRPETHADMPFDVCEFKADSMRQEAALYRIYAQRKEWAGELNKIIYPFHETTLNRLLPEDFDERRANCGMTCLTGGHCSWCFTTCIMATKNMAELIEENAKRKDK